MKKKGFLDISFSWIFALLVGGMILVGAIYGLTKFSSSERSISAVEGAKEISTLLNPLETSFEAGKTVAIQTPVQTRIYSSCFTSEKFGTQGISLSEMISNSWSVPGERVDFKNKYLFSDSVTEGRVFYMFSKTFNFPFKVSTLIYLTSKEKNYCFEDASLEVKNELQRLGQPNIKFEDCQAQDIEVCFNKAGCDIEVRKDLVKKGDEELHYLDDALMYAAIFSEKEIYECNLKRSMDKIIYLTEIYSEKSDFLFSKGCDLDLKSDLETLNNLAKNFQDSSDLKNFENLLITMDYKSDFTICRLW